MSSQYDDQDGAEFEEKKGGSTRILLLVLLLVVAAGGYLYFFTDLLRPQEKPAVTTPPAAKAPLPPRPGEQPAPAVPTAAAPAAQPSAAPAPAPAPAAKPAAPVPAPAAAAKPAAPVPAPAAAAKPAAPVPAPAAAAKPAAPAPAPVAAAKPAAPAPAPAPAAKPPVKEAKPAAKGQYTLLCGEFVLESSVADLKKRLKKVGLTPTITRTEKKPVKMNRLYLASYGSEAEAKAELQKLHKYTKDAYVLKENGKFSVFAGSFLMEGPAAKEQDRLYDLGFKLTMQKAPAPVSMYRATAGSFATKEEAQKMAAKLKKLKVEAVVRPLHK